ncbi:MAG: ATP-binding protein, partial [Thermoleophilia bacterium]
RPLRAPHHTISAAGLVGGGATPRPGEVSLAHLGVLFLDEFAEFRTSALEGLRQPLEDGHVTISRSLCTVTYPARHMLIAAMNPCPCGFRGDPVHDCHCPEYRLRAYQNRLSGPLLDRIDMRLDVPRLTPHERRRLIEREGTRPEASVAVRARVAAARKVQLARFAGTGVYANAHMNARQLRRYGILDAQAVTLLDNAYERLRLSARACDRIVRVARTIADLAGAKSISADHVRESISYRVQVAGEG